MITLSRKFSAPEYYSPKHPNGWYRPPTIVNTFTGSTNTSSLSVSVTCTDEPNDFLCMWLVQAAEGNPGSPASASWNGQTLVRAAQLNYTQGDIAFYYLFNPGTAGPSNLTATIDTGGGGLNCHVWIAHMRNVHQSSPLQQFADASGAWDDLVFGGSWWQLVTGAATGGSGSLTDRVQHWQHHRGYPIEIGTKTNIFYRYSDTIGPDLTTNADSIRTIRYRIRPAGLG